MGDYPQLLPIHLPPNTVRDICRRAMKECNWRFKNDDEKWHFHGISGNAWYGEGKFDLRFEVLRDRGIQIHIDTDIDQTRPVAKLLESIDKYVKQELSELGELKQAEREEKSGAACNGLVFVSYAHEDKKFAQRLGNDVYLFGFEVWIDEASLHVGDIWPDEIIDKIGKAVAVLVVGSTEGLNAPWVKKEVDHALDRQKKILPVIYKQTEFPDWFRKLVETVQYKNLSRQRYGPGLLELIDVLNKQVGM
jgi:hypothetical protein